MCFPRAQQHSIFVIHAPGSNHPKYLHAVEHGAHYVDVSGDDHFYALVSAFENKMVADRVTCILSVGLFPGLSEFFSSYYRGNTMLIFKRVALVGRQ